MTLNLSLPLDAQDDINKGIQDAMDDMTQEAPKKPAKKPAKNKPKADKPKAEPKVKEPKPEPMVIKGADGTTYEIAEGVDPATVEAEAKVAQAAIDAINNKDADLLGSYMALGKFQSEASKLFKSSKLYGQFLKNELPASQALDAALRSNCKWLYEAMNVEGAEGFSDLLHMLGGINRLEDYKSANPTVIKRAYKQAKKKADKLAEAEKAGIAVEDEDEALEALAKKEEASEKRKATRDLNNAIKRFEALVSEHHDKNDSIKEASDILREVLSRKSKEQIEYLLSL
ncbi:MAG: hypothetical protein IE937_01055 [Gammaproteobacteria bacterium]|nr:hypothetical protein [Gammaproteobacteria bacterium]